jgi:hypothetical protein
MATLQTAKAPSTSPPLEGKTPLQRFHPRRIGRKGTDRATTRIHKLPALLIAQARGRSRGRTWRSRRKFRRHLRRGNDSGLEGTSGAAEEKPLRRGENRRPEGRRWEGARSRRRLKQRSRRHPDHGSRVTDGAGGRSCRHHRPMTTARASHTGRFAAEVQDGRGGRGGRRNGAVSGSMKRSRVAEGGAEGWPPRTRATEEAATAPGEAEHARRGTCDVRAGDREGRREELPEVTDQGPEAAAVAGGGRSGRRRRARTRRQHGRHCFFPW